MSYNVNFQLLGAKGEDIVDDSIWIIKSLYPWIPPEPTSFMANRAIIVVRNPLDSILSWYHYLTQMNHSTKAPYRVDKDYPQLFDWWVKNQVPKMVKHYGQYMQEARQRKMPYHFVRFEDLVADPRPHYEDIMKYLLQLESLEGTNAMRRIQEVLN